MTEEKTLYVRKASGLIREVGPFTVMSIGASYAIADGFYYYTMQTPYTFPGVNALLSLLISGVMMSLTVLCIMFVTVAMPRAGGEYIHVSRIIHPVLGIFASWQDWQANIFTMGGVACTTTIFFGELFHTIGLITGSSWWTDLGISLSAPLAHPEFFLTFAIATCVVCWILALLGLRVYKWWINILFIVPLIGGVITMASVGYMLLSGLDAVKTGWDATFGSGAWNEVVSVANENGWSEYIASTAGNGAWGWPGPWSMSATTSSLVTSGYAYWGICMGNMVAGEVKEPSRSMVIGILGAIILTASYYIIGAFLVFSTYGDFISKYNYVILGGYSDQLKIMPVLYPSFSLFAYGPILRYNPIVAFVISFTAAIWCFNFQPLAPLVTSRIMFAWAFDRMFPTLFARVHPKYHSPTWAVHLAAALWIVAIFMTWQNPWFLSMICFTGVFWRYFFYALSAVVLPYSRPDVFERGFTWRIFGLPVISLIGLIALGLDMWLMFPVFEWILSDVTYIWWTIGWWLWSILMYVVFYTRNIRQGVDMSEIYRTVPPA